MTTAQKNNTTTAIQTELGIPEERHYSIKEPLLKETFGPIVSNLALTQFYDEEAKKYNEPEPTYSLYYTEKIRNSDGSVSNKFIPIPLPKDSETIKAFAEHLFKVSKAIEGIDLKVTSAAVDDLDAALAKLKSFKKA